MNRIDGRDGRIVVNGAIGPPHLHVLCAALDREVNRQRSAVELDFSACRGVTQAVMLPLMPVVAQYRETRGIAFDLVLPRDPQLARLFENANWGHHIDPANHPANPYRGGHVPALRFGEDGADGQAAILDRVLELIVRNLDTSRDTLKAVEWSLGEVMENVVVHAESEVGGFVQATAFETGNKVEFVVADAGIGVPASIGTRDDEEALRDAITEGVTRDRNRNAGNFRGVGVVTSSFADEFFGRLFVALGPRAFMSRVRMINVDPTVEGLIDRAILQRTRLGHGDSDS